MRSHRIAAGTAGVLALCASLHCMAGGDGPASSPFGNGDPKLGEQLFNKGNCSACHIARFGGTGEQMFTRPKHKVTTPGKLAGQIAACNTNLKAGWFPEDEEHVAAYLNQKYYKLK